MSQALTRAERVMSIGDYLALPDELRAEYVDGRAIVNPPPSFAHQKICQRLTALLEAAVTGEREVVAAAGWQIASDHVRIPDIMLLAKAPEGPFVTDTPLLCVEVLSTNRSDDLVRKSIEYLEAGVAQYWVVDPRDRVLDAYSNAAGWHSLLKLTDDNQAGTLALPGDAGQAELDLSQILG